MAGYASRSADVLADGVAVNETQERLLGTVTAMLAPAKGFRSHSGCSFMYP
jgi:hypothetical protein